MAEQDEDLLAVLIEELSRAGWEVVPARSVAEANRVIAGAAALDVILVDEHWPAPGAMATEHWFSCHDVLEGVPLVMMTASVPNAPSTHECLTIDKPFNARELVRVLGALATPQR